LDPLVSKSRSRNQKRRRESNERNAPSERLNQPGWRYRIGRLLQSIGLFILPFGIASELLGRVGLGQSLLIGGSGALVFYIGYVIQNRP
jgi:hypothetical protein